MGKDNKAKRAAKSKAKKKAAVKKKQRHLEVIGQPRKCRECTVCCTVFGVDELDKEPWTDCEHRTDAGCSIYADRPKYCRTFYCLWQTGLGEMEHRPDKIKVVFAPTNGILRATGQQEIQAYEVEPGAFDTAPVLILVQKLMKKGALIIGHVYGEPKKKRLMGNPVKVAKAKAILAESGLIQ